MATNGHSPDFPRPAGAVTVGEWDEGARYFHGKSWKVDPDGDEFDAFTVHLAGFQLTDASVRRHVLLDMDTPNLGCVSAGQARQLAACLIEAAAEIDETTAP